MHSRSPACPDASDFILVISGHRGSGRPGQDQGGAEDGHDGAAGSRTRRAGRDERRGERRAAERGRPEPAQRGGESHRGAEERACQAAAAGEEGKGGVGVECVFL